MKYGKLMTLLIIAIAAIAFLVPGTTLADGPTLYPGYIDGTVTVGDLNVTNVSVSSSGGGFSSSKSVTGNTYSLTVQTGDFDTNVYANAIVRPVDANYPYTRMYFNNRSVNVPENTHVQNDYNVNPGTVRFAVSITGDSFSSWYVRGYGNNYITPPAERTDSRVYTSSYYTPEDTIDMYVVPNQQVRIYAYVYIDGKRYDIGLSSPYIYKDIAAGETVVIPVNIVHKAVDDPTFDTGSIQGTIDLGNIENLDYHRVYSSVSGDYKNTYLYDNPDTYSWDNVKAVSRYVYAYTYMNGYKTRLTWPSKIVDVAADQNYTVDFVSDSGVLTGDITFTGTLKNEDMNDYYMYAQGTRIYVPGSGWVNQPTYGYSSYEQQYGTDPDNTYKLFLPPGQWQTSQLNASAYNDDLGYRSYSSMTLYDYNRYYDGNSYKFGQNVNITAGQTTVSNIDHCNGSVLLRFTDASGGLLRNPSVSGYARVRNEQNRTVTQWSISGSSNAPLMANPEVEVHGPDGLYDLSCAAYTEDGSRITFARVNVDLECSVRKYIGFNTPEITVDTPEANSTIVAQSVTVSGTVTDDEGVASIEVNGISLNFWSTGNPEDSNEVAFSYDLPVTSGVNTITVTATDTQNNQSSDERDITVYLPADIKVKPEATNNSLNGTATIFVQLPDGLTATASLNIMDNREITATPDQYPVETKLSDDYSKIILKFDRTPELMEDSFFTVQGTYCPNPSDPAECYTWQGSDTTKK